MSHFVCWVFGNDVEGQLEAYCEHSAKSYTLKTLQEIEEEHIGRIPASAMDIIRANLKGRDPIVIVSEEMLYDKEGQPSAILRDACNMGANTVLVADDQGSFKVLAKVSQENGKWDWYIIGGRWKGQLRLKPDTIPPKESLKAYESDSGLAPANIMEIIDKKLHEVMGKDLQGLGPENYPSNAYNRLPKGMVDFKAMEDEYMTDPEGGQLYLRAREIISGVKWLTWAECVEQTRSPNGWFSRAKAEERYTEQNVIKILRKELGQKFMWLEEALLKLPDEHFERVVRGNAWRPLAFVRNGQWYERGRMGWFGVTYDEMGWVEWTDHVEAFLAEVPDTEMITVVDCHI